MSEQVAVELTGLTKRYQSFVALDRVALSVNFGSIFGFLGPNGAGKTTTLRILTGLTQPTSGTAKIFGHDVVNATNEVRALTGFLPDVPGFYPWMSAPEVLRFSGELFGLSAELLKGRVPMLLEMAGLAGVQAKVGGYSRGMKQRLGIAQALINAPRLLLLDEPTSALDPIGRRDVLSMISALSGRTTVFFSTHILSDVERVCDHVAILHQGRVAAQSSIRELKARYGEQALELELADGAERLEERLRGALWLGSCSREEQRLRVTVKDLPTAEAALPAMIAELHLRLRRLEAKEKTLEEIFIDLVGRDA